VPTIHFIQGGGEGQPQPAPAELHSCPGNGGGRELLEHNIERLWGELGAAKQEGEVVRREWKSSKNGEMGPE